ncbi:MAG: sulfatase-like hydrolase/transferase [Deltaproteobacteria bacterium]|nr:sulfatase-like hydrolase/transferase [Deltaproteobacteria bacterium]
MNSKTYLEAKHERHKGPILRPFVLVFFALIALSACLGCSKTKRLPALEDLNLLLIVMDTVGSEHIGAYGKTPVGRNVSPQIDRLAAEGVLFKRAYAAAPWTMPSIASILTGQMPWRHGVMRPQNRLADDRVTLAELLKSRGYASAAVTSHMLLEKEYGLVQGFDKHWQVNQGLVHQNITSDLVSDTAIKWLQELFQEPQRPKFFLMLHYFDPHFNYREHPSFGFTQGYTGPFRGISKFTKLDRMKRSMTPADKDYIVGTYHEEIAFMDMQIGRVLAELENVGCASETLVIIVGDHGEGFMRHGYMGHTISLYDELIHVPLIFSLPGVIKPAIVTDLVHQVDIVPTLMDMSRHPGEDFSWDGVSLKTYLEGGRDLGLERVLFAELNFRQNLRKNAIIDGDYKLIHNISKNKKKLFDLKNDPEEQQPLRDKQSEIFKALSEKLARWEQQKKANNEVKTAPPRVKIDTEQLDQLKTLGYM